MIKNLRKKFTIVAMSSMFVVLAAIISIFNAVNYVHLIGNMDDVLHMIEENGGRYPSPEAPGNEPKKMEREQEKPPMGEREHISPEAPYQTRYFSVRMNEQGEVLSSDLHNIAAVSEEEAKQYAAEIFSSQKAKGFKDIYRYLNVKTDSGSMVIFLDSRKELESFRTNLLTSVGISFAGLFSVLVLVLIFSKLVFRPVAEAYQKQKQFITDASHEIKTPLTIIDANTEVIEMEFGESEWTKSIQRQVQRLVNLTQQMVILAKLEEENAEKQKREFSLSNAVQETIQPFEVFAKTSGKVVETEIQEGISLLGEEQAIRQMIDILADNAIKYSLPNSTVKVSLKRKGKKIQLEICNETEHIPEGNLDMLFERFYRLDASRNSETGGSGIGLSVARAIVDAHHGQISARSDDGRSIHITAVFRAIS